MRCLTPSMSSSGVLGTIVRLEMVSSLARGPWKNSFLPCRRTQNPSTASPQSERSPYTSCNDPVESTEVRISGHSTAPTGRRTLCTPLNTVLPSFPHPASFRLLASHSGSHPNGRNAFISAATHSLPSHTVQKSGLIPYRSLTATSVSVRSSHSTQANSPRRYSVKFKP